MLVHSPQGPITHTNSISAENQVFKQMGAHFTSKPWEYSLQISSRQSRSEKALATWVESSQGVQQNSGQQAISIPYIPARIIMTLEP